MGLVGKQSLLGSIITYIGVLLGAINVFYIFPKYLDADVIGLLKSIEAIGLLVVPLVYLGIPFSISKFYPILKHQNDFKFKILLSKTLFFLILNSILFSILFFLFKDFIADFFIQKSPLLSDWILMSIPVLIGMSWLTVFMNISTANLKLAVPKFLERVFLRSLHLLIIVLFTFSIISEHKLLIYYGLSYLLPPLILFLYLKHKKFILFSIKDFKNNRYDFSEQKSYTMFMSLSTISGSIITYVGTVMVSSLLGLEYAGIYFIAFYMGFILDVPASNFSAILRPVISSSIAKDDYSNILNLYQKSSIVQLLFSSFLYLLLFANINEIFFLMPNGETFVEGKAVVLIVGAGYLIKNLFGCHFDILIMSKYFKLSVVISVLLSIVTLIMYYYFINFMGLMGAAITAIATLLAKAIITAAIIKKSKQFGFHPFTKKTFYLVGLILFILILLWFFPVVKVPILSIIIKSSLIFILFVPFVLIFKIIPTLKLTKK